MIDLNPIISIITFNVDGHYTSNKRKIIYWVGKKARPNSIVSQTDIKHKEKNKLKLKGWKKIYHTNCIQKKDVLSVLISDKLDSKPKNIIRKKEGHLIMINGAIHQEDTIILNMYDLIIEFQNSWRNADRIKVREMEKSTTITKDF